jgi:di- and tripeptidase
VYSTRALLTSQTEQLVESLRQFIAYKTVSSDPRSKADCRRAASWLRSLFKRYGAVTELLNTEQGFNPVVFAKFQSTSRTRSLRKRILFYGHYDVVAAKSKLDKGWLSDPFEMQGTDGYLYGRGASDNKGPIMAAAYAVAELVAENALDCDVIFLIEGEEESGSRGFKQCIMQNKAMIGNVDWILIANSYWLDDEVPCLTYGLRGVIHATIDIQSDEPDLHSGVDGSSLLDEPLKDLMALLSGLNGPHGRVQIPHFYDDILPVTSREKALYDDIARTLLERNPKLATPEALTKSLLARWADATLTIHNFKTSGPQNSTIIPRQAQASLSLRLVPNQSVVQIAADLTTYMHAAFLQLESKNHITVTIGNQAEPWLGDYTNKLFKTLERAIMDVWSPKNNRRKQSLGTTNQIRVNGTRRPSAGTKDAPTTSSTLAQSSNTPTSDTAPPFEPQLLSPMSPKLSATRSSARKPLYIREGGSIPAIRFLEREFGAPAAHLPCGQASDNAHLDNERFRVLNLYNSKEIFKRVFLDLPRE